MYPDVKYGDCRLSLADRIASYRETMLSHLAPTLERCVAPLDESRRGDLLPPTRADDYDGVCMSLIKPNRPSAREIADA